MKPDWDKLMAEFKDDKTKLIADVDCTAAGQPLCTTHGIRGYPSIKHGDPNSLEDYNGGRSFSDLQKFAEGLKALCSPMNMDLCDEESKTKITDLQKLSDSELGDKIKEEEKKIEDAESTFKSDVEKLQKQYQELMDTKDKTIADVKAAGLGLMKSVQAASKSGKKEEL